MSLTRHLPVRAATRALSRRRLALLVTVALIFPDFASPLCAQGQQPGGAAFAAREPAAAREVRLTLTVTNEKGHYVGGVTREHVGVFEGKSAREIRSFDRAEEHASVGALFDISRSMHEGRGQRIEWSRQAFARFVQQASPLNEYFLRAFNKHAFDLAGWTRDAATIKEGLDKIAPAIVTRHGDGGTAFYDACASALAKLAAGPHPRRVLLIFTDGMSDNYSQQARQKDLRRMVRDSGALLYAVALYEKHNTEMLDFAGQAELDGLVSASGGKAFFAGSLKGANAAVDQIAVELRHQYVVAFAAADAAKKGELNKVRVRIKPPPDYKRPLRVRSREGYTTPE